MGMTREEIIEIFNEVLLFGKAHCTRAEFEELAKMSIKALEQELTKNDLGVNAVSRQAVIDAIFEECSGTKLDIDFAKVLMLQRAIKALPSVTSQEPRKGHWVLTDVEGNKVWHCHCSECGKDPQDYVGGSENWWLIKSKLPKFCPSCGSDNREVAE